MPSRWIVTVVVACVVAHLCGAQGVRPRHEASSAPAPRPCRVLCGPSVTLMPGVIRTHLFGGPTVRTLATGAVKELGGSRRTSS